MILRGLLCIGELGALTVFPALTLYIGTAFLRANWHVRKRKKLKASEVRKGYLVSFPPFTGFNRRCCRNRGQEG